MIVRWLIGLSLGTLIIAATSPWFVRSYVPRQFDEARQRVVLKPGESYRWRAEGYATTSVGPHGMMGRTNLPTSDGSAAFVLALWGDSQAEGVSVADTDKLWRQLESALGDGAANGDQSDVEVQVIPLASSGDDAGSWRRQMPLVERELNVDGHVLLLCEMVDLMGMVEPLDDRASVGSVDLANTNSLANWIPDFVVHAGRNLSTDPQTTKRRRLRFGIGPVPTYTPPTQVTFLEESDRVAAEGWIAGNLNAIRAAATKPIWIVYAPRCPLIMDGELRVNDPDGHLWDIVEQNAEANSFEVIDCRDVFRDSVERSVFPHGFHNGQFGNGHLNAVGYRLISREFAKRWGGAEILVHSAEVSGAAE
ncbi:hypothetical protein [Rhodopirellula bahusiensis]|uniref:hypothetical protein n=1 Tax=Rhodopirellula bahusiensis TaxID=2014065 RepID=UPI0032656EC1